MYSIRVLTSVWVANVVSHSATQRVADRDLSTVIGMAILAGEALVRSGLSMRSCPASRVSVSYEFGPGIPQAMLKPAWTEACVGLQQIVTTLPFSGPDLHLQAEEIQLQGTLGLTTPASSGKRTSDRENSTEGGESNGQ